MALTYTYPMCIHTDVVIVPIVYVKSYYDLLVSADFNFAKARLTFLVSIPCLRLNFFEV